VRRKSFVLRIEELEPRLALSLPASAPPLPAPPPPSASVVWVNTEPALQAAFKNIQSGETIVIQPGTYNLTSTLYIGASRHVTNITVEGATNNLNDVVLLGKGMDNSSYGNVPMGISVYNAQNVTIENLSIGDVWYFPIDLQSIQGANDVHIYHLNLFDAGEQFIKASGGGVGVSNSSVEYTSMQYTAGPPKIDHGGGIGYTNGIDVKLGTNWTILDNLFENFHTPDADPSYNHWNPAVLMWDFASNATVEGNTFINCDRAIAFGLQDQTTGYDFQGGIISNNFIYQAPGLFSAARRTGSDGQIIVWDSPGTQVDFNTILTNGNSIDSIQTRWTTTGVAIDDNLADAPIGARNGSVFTQAGNYLLATPSMFVNPSAGNLNLVLEAATQAHVINQVQPLSSVLADWNGNPRPAGQLTDIGADEYVASTNNSPIIVDNGSPGYAETGTGWTNYGLGYNGTSRYHAPGTGADTASWQIANLSAGNYAVNVTWPPGANRATNATYQVYDGTKLLATVVVNQKLTPTGTIINGTVFQSLGSFAITSGTLRVVLSDNANGFVFADAIAVVPG